MTRTRGPGAPGTESLPTEIESWLLDMGLRAIQVERCPISDCEICAAAAHRRRAA